ncbi:DUF4405 domain-containing protein [Afifella marina]|uniref:Uncharacterized protein n=1 Tax=Afifella marina DSM 2698 TaxID=1120955 RepID=A0A1G5M801_AFIMA|nr:DUF4405 domain-containing protein [Afifella marina]MBK1622852.1 DUF4405 domain-containing protein [Afifella marina DSM 2698]MBK1625847.1 DUF4405 domain-containing protein [Afifella marina]MBK5917669.1 DUF4405 domain-containing protein [Afifella marina]RAI23592.1 DUF4405 domain-containing protein [Afifella marina DSM 2698]SCZ21236.1 hypothetical protein SAMN03080610_00235 [Afifella marina DSM 2698]
MPSLINRYATPFITGLFIVSLISGIALFFHVGPSGFHGMHEWLSMVLILPFILHIWKNWRPLTNYFKRSPMVIALAVSLLISLPFLMPTSGETRKGPPPFAFSHQILTNSASAVAPLLGMTGDDVAARLRSAGVELSDPDQPIADAISKSGANEMRAIGALLTPAR